MPDVDIRVEGLDLVQANLRRVQRETPTALAAIGREVAVPIAAAAQRKARRLTGRMAASIRIAPVSELNPGADDWITAGEGLEYAGVQHYGWLAHGIEPNPFLTDAVSENVAGALADYERRVAGFIERVWVDS